MNYSELLKVIDKRAKYKIKDLEIDVKVKDMKEAYGQLRYLITPVSGEGFQWVNDYNIKLLDEVKSREKITN